MTLAALFTHPMQINGQTFWLLIPVSIAVAIVYKTIRTESLRTLPLEIAKLIVYILAGETALLLAGWAFLSWRVA